MLRQLILSQSVIALFFAVFFAFFGGVEGILEVAVALAASMLYAFLGVMALVGKLTTRMLVVRHVFRCLLIGLLLVALPLFFVGRVSLITICSFVVIHHFAWWWVFMRKGAKFRYATWQRSPKA